MKKANVIQAFFKIFPRYVRVSPWLFSLVMVANLAQGVLYGIVAPMTQLFLDRVVGFTVREMDFSYVVFGLLIFGSTHIAKNVANGIAYFLLFNYFRKAEGVFSLEVHEKASRLDPTYFENTQTLDDLNKAIPGIRDSAVFTGTILHVLTFYLPYYIIMAIYLLSVKPLLLIALLFVFIPVLLTQFLRSGVHAIAEDKAAPVRREFDYYENCMTGREYFKETRILGALSFFMGLYVDSLALLNKIKFRASVKSDLTEMGVKLLSLAGYAGTILLLFDALMKGEIGVGAFAAVYGSVVHLFSLTEEMVCHFIGRAARDFGRVQNYLRFLQMPERNGKDVEIPNDADILLHRVSFFYPGAERKAVDDVTLSIRNGETVAVVGENGSGKTTLVRLITGLYLPNEGSVLYGNIDTKDVSTRSLYSKTSAVFQKYQRYQMTLRENIGISDVNKLTNDAVLENVCTQAGIDKNDSGFTKGFETMLSREFDGIDLSGGQWQRVAIARSFFRSHQFIVLDEPTAAIDPVEETKIYYRFAEISKNKTAIIITHRLGSVKLANRIFVMKQGSLVEQGTHSELMNMEGEYARLYRSQEQ